MLCIKILYVRTYIYIYTKLKSFPAYISKRATKYITIIKFKILFFSNDAKKQYTCGKMLV